LENRKIVGIVLFVVALLFVILNLLVIYPFINCELAPLTFWLLAGVCIIVGLILYFDVQVFHFEEEEEEA